jgi:hypothetical protein
MVTVRARSCALVTGLLLAATLSACAAQTVITLPSFLAHDQALRATTAAGYAALSHAPVERPTEQRVRDELPALLKAFQAAAHTTAETKSLESFAPLVPADSRLALTLAGLLQRHGFDASTHGELFIVGPGIVLGDMLPELRVVGLRATPGDTFGIDVFVTLEPDAPPSSDLEALDFAKVPAMRLTAQSGHLVFVAFSPALFLPANDRGSRQFQ